MTSHERPIENKLKYSFKKDMPKIDIRFRVFWGLYVKGNDFSLLFLEIIK